MFSDNITNYENKDFDKFIEIKIYIQGIYFFEKEEDKHFIIHYKRSDFELFRGSMMNILKDKIEEKTKKYIITKIKENHTNIIELSHKYNVPVKNLLYCYFINNRIDNIDIIWSSSAMKEFNYIPVNHYLDHEEDDDSIYLKVKGIKLKKKI